MFMFSLVVCTYSIVQNICFLQKEDDLTFETFHHRSGKEFQCIYQSGMRFYLDDWGSKVSSTILIVKDMPYKARN